MTAAMRSSGPRVAVAARCVHRRRRSTDDDPTATQTLRVRPVHDPAGGSEVTSQCVQITLHNDDDLYVN